MASKSKRTFEERQREADMTDLLARPQFRRFLLRVFLESGMSHSAYGSEDRRLLMLEGRRSLGFDIFGWCDADASQPERNALRLALAEDLQPPGASDDHRNDPDLDLDA
jgi:hypothetical protein